MTTRYYKIEDLHSAESSNDALAACGEIIRRGGLVCFPTETVYGLGADARNPKAVRAIYEAKGRPADNPLIVHVADIEMVASISEMTERERQRFYKLAEEFWPGPLTMIVTKSAEIPREVSCGLSTVGIRFPEHPVAAAFIEAAGVPIAAPSANASGRASPTLARHVMEDMDGRVDAVIDGGPCQVGLESTVIDLTGDTPCILRPGGITLEMVRKVLPDVRQLEWHGEERKPAEEAPRSPGLKYKHYAPRAKTVILQGDPLSVSERIQWALDDAAERGVSARALVALESAGYFRDRSRLVCLGGREDKEAQAASLFRLLRELDEDGIAEAYVEAMPEDGIGFAVMNRLYRAAGCSMVPVKKVMFVCTGNTCRSFMAEYIYKSVLKTRMAQGELSACAVSVSSAGIYAADGSAGSRTAEEVLKLEFGIDGSGHRTRLLTYDRAHEADLLLTMTEGHKAAVLRAFSDLTGKVFTLGEYGHGQDIQDPFMGSYGTYRACAGQIAELIKGAEL